MAFALGLGVGLAALLACANDRRVLAAVLGAATTLSSPVAGAFLVLACAAWWLAAAPRARRAALRGRRDPAGPRDPARVPRQGGAAVQRAVRADLVRRSASPSRSRRRAASARSASAARWPRPRSPPRGRSTPRSAATSCGSPRSSRCRCSSARSGRRAGCCCSAWRPIAIAWQWSADAALSVYDASPTLHAQSFYLPLVEELNRRKAADGPFRTEVVPLREHWETRWIPPGLPIARGWERQLDVALNPAALRRQQAVARRLPALAARAVDRLRRRRPRAVRQGRAQGGRAPAPRPGGGPAARLAFKALEALRRAGLRGRSRRRPRGSPRSARTP